MITKRITLNITEREVIRNISLEGINEMKKYEDENILQFVAKNSHRIPDRIKTVLKELKSGDYHLLEIKNMDLDSLKDKASPEKHRAILANKDLSVADLSHAFFSFYLGKPIGYEVQQKGRLINDIIPVKMEENKMASSTSSEIDFHFHTEDSFLLSPPNFICLSCIRNAEKAVSRLAYFDENLLSKESISLLEKPIYNIAANALQAIGKEDAKEKSVLFKSPFGLAMRYNHQRIYGEYGSAEREAILELKSLLDLNAYDHIFEEGSIYLINNKKVAHARSKFKADFSNKKRWLLRTVIQ